MIDIHHHISPPRYTEVVGAQFNSRNPANAANILGWTPSRSIEAMDASGIAAAVTSISTPGVWLGDVLLARRLARECNEYAARMTNDYPGRFGFFATVPMPDLDSTLDEIRYAFDVLGADGVGLMSNYGSVWPGDPSLAPVLDELNRRSAIVYVHPILPVACAGMMAGVGESALEYLFDTARAIASLLYNGSFIRWPNIRFIFPHAGGALPPLAERVSRMADRDRRIDGKPAVGSLREIKQLYFDVATSTNPVTMAGLLRLASIDRIMFGTDFPFVSSMSYTIDPLRSYGLAAADLHAVESGNARRLFSRFSQSAG